MKSEELWAGHPHPFRYALFISPVCEANKTIKVHWMVYNLNRLMPSLVREGGTPKV
ncbi:MAG: hypothetical protein IKE65_02745 [Clostridia bacterium]|nr:hypothetical protein [Clostridia bacterium]